MHYQWRDENLILRCQIQPRASRNEIIGVHHQYLKIAITSAPVDGKANTELISFLAKSLGCPKGQITLLRGTSSRQKAVELPAAMMESLPK